ncbi:MAG: SUMF1/EgtB/PvdO family nonheme iron enzyme [Verrucomicrobiota bacterium]
MKHSLSVGLALALLGSVAAQAAQKGTAPEFVTKATWQETLIASRETVFQWECSQDVLAMQSTNFSPGPWYVLGPLPAKSKDVDEIRNGQSVDLSRRYLGQEGKEIGWEINDQIKDGQLNDLTGYRGATKDSVFILCRTLIFKKPMGRAQLYFELAADRASGHWLPGRKGPGLQSTLPLLRGGSELQADAGEQQFVLTLWSGAEGKHRFFTSLKPNLNRPGAGDMGNRKGRRQQVLRETRAMFTNAMDQILARWEVEDHVWGDPQARTVDDWLPGEADAYLKPAYQAGVQRRLSDLNKTLAETAGVKALALAPLKERVQAWCDAMKKAKGTATGAAALREQFYQLATVQETINLAGRVQSLRLAVADQREMFRERHPKAESGLRQIAGAETTVAALWPLVLENKPEALAAVLRAGQMLTALQADLLLDTPLLGFGRLLLVKGQAGFSSNWGGPNRLGNELIVLSPVRPDGKQTTVYKGAVSDMDLHWDGNRLLFSDGNTLREMNVDGTGLRQVSAADPPVSHYDGCYLPNGKIVCASAACEQAVPCTGGGGVGNLHILDADGKNERRVTYDQDHDWNPVVLNDGRVLYTRWEYTDLPHYFSRLLFRMNPDGSSQMEYYGSGSYWPNAMYWPRPIPGHPTEVVCVVSGHHGVSRVGELLILDPAKGRQEASGAVQRIPGYGKKVEPIIQDNLVGQVWPRFAAPYPLAEPGSNLGAGKYFLVCMQQDPYSTWDLYLADIYDNLTPILTGGYMTPIPLQSRPLPPVIPSTLTTDQPDGVIYLSDIYQGNGLRGYPRGSIKALRVGTHHYRYPGNGDTRASSLEGGWDVKRILGTVPVNEDGSALFRVPANTPIFLQPLDAEGKAQQQMRSWYTAMPGEFASCIGCHEQQNNGPAAKYNLAAMNKPMAITPWNGPVRGFSFDREVQPVLDRRCVGCHDGKPYQNGGQAVATPDLRAKRLHPEFKDNYSPAYLVLQKYVRRAGYESDMHMHVPAEFEADTSVLVQMLKKGHYNVELTRDDWERLYTWIDYNLPYPANWRESHRPPPNDLVERRAKYKKVFSNLDDQDEAPQPLPEIAAFEPPKPMSSRQAQMPKLENWPMTADQAKAAQKAVSPAPLELDLGDGVTMKFAMIPAGKFVMGNPNGFPDESPASVVTLDRPFYLGQMEVTLRQYARFDAKHENGFVEGRGKDRTTRGVPLDVADYPVVRVSWNEAMAFCEWLSHKTGQRCTLPTEAQWEYACRAGTDAMYSFGEYAPGKNNLCNIADAGITSWNYGRCEPGYSDGVAYLGAGGRYAPNAWGLLDMHGNAAEWCLSTYKPYPYKADDGRDDPRAPGLKVVRGGSWNDTMRYVTSASRWRYQPHQPVYNVGFRVLVESRTKETVVTASAK